MRDLVDQLEAEINSAFGTDAVHRLVAEKVAQSRWLKDRQYEAWQEGLVVGDSSGSPSDNPYR